MSNSTFVFLVVSLAFLSGCRTPSPSLRAAEAPAAPVLPNLTQEEAGQRASAVANVAYDLEIDLGDGKNRDAFSGAVAVSFSLKKTRPLFLDFKSGGAVVSLEVNGKAVENPVYVDHRVHLPAGHLRSGANVARVVFRQGFMRDGSGLFRFDDPEDGRSYVFTQFQPFYANAMFPCFDQPDLRAPLKMRVIAPKDWKVVTASRELSIEPRTGGKNAWHFHETPPVSTYLYSLHAGPFKVWESSAETGAGKVQLRLFARQAMKKFVVPEDWFAPIRHGMKFFGDMFAYPYPFAKYDQVIAPDFTSIAMENLASVLFTEDYLHRGRATNRERYDRDNTILHELAHHWFGNLVTMEWWDDLWLNESFATYMATLAQAAIPRAGREAWLDFHAEQKSSAYFEDQLVTTHAIGGPVVDTQSAFAVFDSITYGKGASVLKQLSHRIGAERFRDGLRAYFKKHAYKNARLVDFMGALEKASGTELGEWSRVWLETAGLDTVEAKFRCEGGKTAGVEVHLMGPDGKPSPRSHMITVGLFGRATRATGPLAAGKSVSIELRAPVTRVAQLEGEPCPLFVNANEGDHGYFRMRLDPRSLTAARERILDLNDPLSRMVVWSSLYEMLREGTLAPQGFLETAGTSLAREPEQRTAEHVLAGTVGYKGRGFASALQYLPSEDQGVTGVRRTWDERVESAVWSRFIGAAPGSDRQLRSLDDFVMASRTAVGAARLADFVEGKASAEGLSIDRDRRWGMIVRASSLGEPRARRLIEREKKRDRSDRASLMSLAAEAARPDLGVKQAWFEKLLSAEPGLSLSRQSAVMENILPEWQTNLRESFAEPFFAALPSIGGKFDQEFLEKFARGFAPSLCSDESAGRLRAFVDAQGARLPPAPLRTLRIERQEDWRCADLRGRAARLTAGENR